MQNWANLGLNKGIIRLPVSGMLFVAVVNVFANIFQFKMISVYEPHGQELKLFFKRKDMICIQNLQLILMRFMPLFRTDYARLVKAMNFFYMYKN